MNKRKFPIASVYKRATKVLRNILCLALAVLLPCIASAAAPGESAWFEFEHQISTEHFDIISVQFTRISNEYVMVAVLIETPAVVTKEAEEALSSLSFVWLRNPDDTDALSRLIAKEPPTSTADASIGMEIKESEGYLVESQWSGIDKLPSVLYLLPVFENTGEQEKMLVLHLDEGYTWDFEDLVNTRPPPTDTEGRENMNG